MRIYVFLIATVLTLANAIPSLAAEKPRTAQENQNQSKKVWTNDDMDQLRARGLISIVGQVSETTTHASTAPSEPVFPIYASRLEDPEWYADKAADLQVELNRRADALREARMSIARAAERITQPGIALDVKNAGISPEAGIAILEAQVGEVKSQLDELSDLARQNGIPQGVLRG
jgi:hypothetical protein